MRLDKLFSEIDYSADKVNFDTEIERITVFAENCDKNSVFIALHPFDEIGGVSIDIALGRGVKAIVLEYGSYTAYTNAKKLPLIFVSDIRLIYAALCDRLCGSPGKKLNLFAVTGTNGKTSVAALLSSILSLSEKTEVIGTVWNEMTTPDPEVLYPLLAKFVSDGVKNVVLEASSHALKLKKLAPLRFKVGIFTNLTRDHGDFHKTEEDYYLSKASLFDYCDNAVINLDDNFGRRLFDECRCKNKFGFSLENVSADFFTGNVCVTEDNIQAYDFCTKNESFPIRSSMPWSFNIYNTLASAGAAYVFGITRRNIQNGISAVEYIPGRLERYIPKNVKGSMPLIFLDYAHTPDALKSAIISLRRIYGNKRLILLFGCGGERDREKRPMMGIIATDLADFTVITTDNSRGENPTLILRDIISSIPPERAYVVIKDRREAICFALEEAEAGDILLIAGKGHENYIIDESGKHRFNEKEIIEVFCRHSQNRKQIRSQFRKNGY